METTANMVTFMKQQQQKLQPPEKTENVRNIFEKTFQEEDKMFGIVSGALFSKQIAALQQTQKWNTFRIVLN